MKYLCAGLLVLAVCVLGWLYQNRPEVLQDAMADLDQDPNGVRAQLTQAQKKITDLTAANAALETENAGLKTSAKDLSDQVTQFKSAAVTAQATTAGAAQLAAATTNFVPPSPIPKQDNWTWTTTDGKTYKSVVITKVEADCVTILDDEGGARIYIVTLPPDLQKLLNYDPAMAKIAGEARVKQEISDQAQLVAEKEQTQQMLKTQAKSDQANPAPTLSDADKQNIQQQISGLQADIRDKLRQIASDYANDSYSRSTSHSAYEDAVAREAQQVNDLRAKIGQTATSLPMYYPYYPYYYYYLP